MGTVTNAISGLQATVACYKDVVEILTNRFGDKRRIEREHLGKPRSLLSVKSECDVKGLRDVYDPRIDLALLVESYRKSDNKNQASDEPAENGGFSGGPA